MDIINILKLIVLICGGIISGAFFYVGISLLKKEKKTKKEDLFKPNPIDVKNLKKILNIENGMEECKLCNGGIIIENFPLYHICDECHGAGALYWVEKLTGNCYNGFDDQVLNEVEEHNSESLGKILNSVFESGNIISISHHKNGEELETMKFITIDYCYIIQREPH